MFPVRGNRRPFFFQKQQSIGRPVQRCGAQVLPPHPEGGFGPCGQVPGKHQPPQGHLRAPGSRHVAGGAVPAGKSLPDLFGQRGRCPGINRMLPPAALQAVPGNGKTEGKDPPVRLQPQPGIRQISHQRIVRCRKQWNAGKTLQIGFGNGGQCRLRKAAAGGHHGVRSDVAGGNAGHLRKRRAGCIRTAGEFRPQHKRAVPPGLGRAGYQSKGGVARGGHGRPQLDERMRFKSIQRVFSHGGQLRS